MRSLIVIVAGLAAAGCATQNKEPPPRPFAGTKWQVQLELPVAGEQPYFRFGDGRMEGFGGCNRIVARYLQDTVGARAIAIGRIETGMRSSCDASTQLAERRMLEVLQSVSSYSITADRLTMSGSAGTLKFRADPPDAGPVPVAQAAAPAPGNVSLSGTRWVGVVEKDIDANAAPRLEFVGEGRMAGFTGCNMLSGSWRMEGGEARFGSIATTKRACLGPAGDVEKRLLGALGGDSRARRDGAKLVIEGPGGARFEFEESR